MPMTHSPCVLRAPTLAHTGMEELELKKSELQLGNTGSGLSNVVNGVNDKLYLGIAQSGSSNPNLHYAIISVPAGHYSLSA